MAWKFILNSRDCTVLLMELFIVLKSRWTTKCFQFFIFWFSFRKSIPSDSELLFIAIPVQPMKIFGTKILESLRVSLTSKRFSSNFLLNNLNNWLCGLRRIAESKNNELETFLTNLTFTSFWHYCLERAICNCLNDRRIEWLWL